jgi:Protein of unknown function with HXXEE motif
MSMTWLWWAPLGAAALHITEEFFYPGGFADWDRMYRPAIHKSITPRLHIVVNAAMLFACLQVGLLAMSTDTEARMFGAVMWLAIVALFFSNAVFHIVGTIRTRTRSPGVVTSVVIYIPLAVAGYVHFIRSGRVSLLIAIPAVAFGGSYHFWAGIMHRARARHDGHRSLES